MNSAKQIKIGAILSYLSIALNIITGLIYTPWMISQIGKPQYGLYTLANSLITLFLIDFGLSSATSRYISKYRADGEEEKIGGFLGAIYKLYLLIDAVIFTVLLILFFFLENIYVKLTPQELEQFKVVYVIAGLFSIVNFPCVTFNGILTSYEQFIPLKISDVIYRILLVALTIVALLLGYGLYALVAIHAIVGLMSIVYKFIVIKKSIPVKVKFENTDRSLYKDIFKFSIWVTVASLAQRLVFNITPSILGVVVDSAAIAVFGVVTTIEGYAYTITTAINGMFLPKISRIYANTDEQDIMPLMMKVGKFQFALNGLLVVGFAVLGASFIGLWMGAGYEEAYAGILLVIIPGLLYNSLQIANTAMIVQNKVKLQAYVNVVMGIVNVVLSVILSSMFGMVGACISIFIAYMFRAIALCVIYDKNMHLDMPKFIKQVFLKMSIPVLLSIVVGVGINYLIPDSGWFIFILKACMVGVVYLGLTLFFATNKEERLAIIRKIKR